MAIAFKSPALPLTGSPSLFGKKVAISLLALLCACLSPLTHAASPDFVLQRDAFAFSNDTVLSYGVDEAGKLHIARRAVPVEFSHRCFVLARGVLQFQQFAQFDPHRPKVSREQYRRLLRQLFTIPVWSSGPSKKIVFPGFADLHGFSIAYEGLLKEDLGNWWPTYLRVGNWRMVMGHLRPGQAAAAAWLVDSLQKKKLRALYLARFPHMNHVVVVYRVQTLPDRSLRFTVYDPNYPGAPAYLDYSPSERSFSFMKRWYFPGGRVNVMRVYISPFH